MAEFKDGIVCRGNGETDAVTAAGPTDDVALVKTTSHEGNDKAVADEMVGKREPEQGDLWKEEDGGNDSKEANKSKALSGWKVGAHGDAARSEVGREHPGIVEWMGAQRCRVRFGGYEEEMDPTALMMPQAVEEAQADKRLWQVGSRCCASYSEDGLYYPAVVVWMKGDRCRVQFEGYGNEEEHNLSDLLSLDELKGPPSSAGDRSFADRKSDWKNSDESFGGRIGARQDMLSSDHPDSTLVQEKTRRGTLQRDSAEIPVRCPSIPLSLFPPVPPLPTRSPTDGMPFIPPVSTFSAGGDREPEPGSDPGADMSTLSSILLSLYMYGYRTGSDMAQQRSNRGTRRSPSPTAKVRREY